MLTQEFRRNIPFLGDNEFIYYSWDLASVTKYWSNFCHFFNHTYIHKQNCYASICLIKLINFLPLFTSYIHQNTVIQASVAKNDDKIFATFYEIIIRTSTRQIWGIWKLRPAYSPETPNLVQNRWCFVPCDLEIWWMTLENNRASLLCCFKLCATFHSHWWIQTGVTVRKRPNLGQIRRFLEQCDLAIWCMTLKNNRAPLLCYFKLYASFRSHQWIQAGVSPETPNLGQNQRFF